MFIRGLKYYVSALFFLLLFSVLGGPNNTEIKIYTKKAKVDLSQVRSFFRTTDLLISRILPKNKSRRIAYSVVLVKDKELQDAQVINPGKDQIRVYLPEDLSEWENNHKVFSDLIASSLLKKSGASEGKNINSIPKWLTYGLLRKILRRNNPTVIPGTISFPGVHALILSGEKTDWLNIIANPMKPVDGPAYNIFLEASEVILDAILRLPEGKKVVLDIIELSNKNQKPEDLLIGVMTKKLDEIKTDLKDEILISNNDSDIVKEWLNYNFKLSAVNVLNPCSASFAEKMFLENRIVKYYAKIEDSANSLKEERFCKIEEIPEKMDDIINLNSLILKKQRDLIRIAFSMPIILQEPVYQMQKSLNLILSGEKEEFKKKYNDQKEKFYDNLEKQHKIEVYILETEKSFVPPGYKYSKQLAVLKKIKELQRQRWLELNKYLDTFSDDKK